MIIGASRVIVAIADEEGNRPLVETAEGLEVDHFIGSLDDVMFRYLAAAKRADLDLIVRVTSDCPLICPRLIGGMLAAFERGDVDYLSNNGRADFPHGLDAEIFSTESLERAYGRCRGAAWRRHVTPWLRRKSPRRVHYPALAEEKYAANLRWTVDYPDDYRALREIWRRFDPAPTEPWTVLAEKISACPEIIAINERRRVRRRRELPPAWRLAERRR